MAQHSNRPKPPPGSITTPAFIPVKPPKRMSVGSMKAVSLGHEEEAPKAFCVVCGGEIVEARKDHESPTRHSLIKVGYNCSKCGIVYAFPPPKGVRKR